MNPFDIALRILGLLPIIAAVWYWLQRFQRGRHLLGFTRTPPIDLVLTTSAVTRAVHGVPASRPLTGYGQVRAVASCAQTLASYYPRKEVGIHLSGFIRNRLDRDLIVLGGPAKNEAARAFLDDFVEEHEIAEFVFDDVLDSLTVRDAIRGEYVIEGFAPEIAYGLPASDFGLIIVTSRRGQQGKLVRTILCAGFTTYGTSAAADYLFKDLVNVSRWQLYRRLGVPIVGRSSSFLVVVSARFSRGECTQIRPVFEIPLKRRG